MPPSIHQQGACGQTKDSQQSSTDFLVGEQIDFLTAKRPSQPVDKPYLFGLQSFKQALRYSLTLADLEPKQVYGPLEMDKATWSRIENGQQAFPPELFWKLATITGNDAPLMWLANVRGYELTPLKTAVEEQLEAERTRNSELERRMALMIELWRETR